MILEVRFHGRGGQGVWTASRLLAEAAVIAGKHAQSFPFFGPERSGAPVTAFARISDRPIRIHAGIERPDIVVVIDRTLIGESLEGLKPNGVLIADSAESPQELRKKFNIPDSVQVWTVRARELALEILGRAITNTALLGAFCKATEEKWVKLDHVLEATRRFFAGRLSEEAINKNLELIRRAYEECVRG